MKTKLVQKITTIMTRLLAVLILSGVLQSVNLSDSGKNSGNLFFAASPVEASALHETITIDDASKLIQFTKGWSLDSNITKAFESTLTRSTEQGASTTLTFSGSQIKVYYAVEPGAGKLQVIVDGKVLAKIDQNARRLKFDNVWKSRNLSSGEHTLVLLHKSGAVVNFDRLVVVNASSAPAQPTSAPTQPPAAPTQAPAVPTQAPAVPTQPPAAPTQPPAVPTQAPAVPTQPPAAPTQPPAVPTQPPPAPTQPPAAPTQAPGNPPAVNTIFNADFETGDFYSFSGPEGEYFGKGVYFQHKIVSSPANGKYAAALTIGSGSSTAAYLFTYKVPSTPLAVYNADYFIPGNITPDSWWNLWQWKSRDNTYDKPIFSLNAVKENGVLQLRMSYSPGGSSANTKEYIFQSNPVPLPTDRWVNITGYYTAKSDNTGSVVVYQDGVKILEKSGIQTKPGGKDVLWSVNSYADQISPNPATIYVDNMRIIEVR